MVRRCMAACIFSLFPSLSLSHLISSDNCDNYWKYIDTNLSCTIMRQRRKFDGEQKWAKNWLLIANKTMKQQQKSLHFNYILDKLTNWLLKRKTVYVFARVKSNRNLFNFSDDELLLIMSFVWIVNIVVVFNRHALFLLLLLLLLLFFINF